ncbi:lipopolysaccharide biosynthesis protein [Soonwooa purpurea]
MLNKLKNSLVRYKTAVLYSSTSIIKALATILAGFFIAKYVSPEDLGLWTAISIALSYSMFIQGGINNGLNLELPFAYGLGDVKKAEKLAGVAQTFSIVTSIIILIVGVTSFIFYPTEDIKLRLGILGITFVIILTFYQTYLSSTYRSNDSFTKLSRIQLCEAFFNLSTILLVYYFSYYGMILKTVITLLFFVILLHHYRPIKIGLIWDKEIFFHLLRVGLPIFILVLLDSFANTIDKVWLIKYTDMSQVGLYSFGLYSLNLFVLFSSSIASYVYPKMTYSYAKLKDKVLLWDYMKKITLLLLIIQTPLVIAGYFLMPFFVENYFPQYKGGVIILQILLFAGLFKGSVIGVNILWSMKSWKYMYIYQIIYTVLLIACTFIGVKFNQNKMTGVALGVLFANFVNFISALILSYQATHKVTNEKTYY